MVSLLWRKHLQPIQYGVGAGQRRAPEGHPNLQVPPGQRAELNVAGDGDEILIRQLRHGVRGADLDLDTAGRW